MFRKLFFLVLWLGCFYRLPAGADPLEQAADAFAALDFEKTLELLEQALGKGGNSPGELVRIYSLRGQALALLGRLAQAQESFRAALSIDPAYRLPPDASPRLGEPFARVLAEKTPPLQLRLEPGRMTASAPPRFRLELVDPQRLAAQVSIFARWAGSEKYLPLRLAAAAGTAVEVQLSALPAPGLAVECLEYYAELYDRYMNRLAVRADADHPLQARLEGEEKPLPAPAQAAAPAAAWYHKWWVWAIVGTAAAAAGGVTAGAFLSRPAARERDFGVVVK